MSATTPLRCTVTGGLGFIGSHLVDRLLADGCAVTAVDDLSTGRLENLAHHRDHPRLRVIRGDVSDSAVATAACDGAERVFHLAALADIVPSIQRPLDYHRANVDGTAAMVEAARRSGVKRFVYAASSSCYGLPDAYPTLETAPARPEYPYALTKFVGEQYVLFWSRVYGLPAISLRFFNVYGPRSRTSGAYGAVFGVFLAQKRAGKAFTVVGDGTQTRDFTFVSDVTDALVRAAGSSVTGEVFNVGSGGTYAINRLVELLGGEVTHLPKRPGEPQRTHADITKIQAMLGWTPKVSFEEGVRVMLAHIDDWRAAPVWTPEAIEEATRDWFAFLSPKEVAQ